MINKIERIMEFFDKNPLKTSITIATLIIYVVCSSYMTSEIPIDNYKEIESCRKSIINNETVKIKEMGLKEVEHLRFYTLSKNKNEILKRLKEISSDGKITIREFNDFEDYLIELEDNNIKAKILKIIEEE